MLHRVIEDRRRHPQDDVITMLVETEIEEDGDRHLLTDDEIYGFARLILTAGPAPRGASSASCSSAC